MKHSLSRNLLTAFLLLAIAQLPAWSQSQFLHVSGKKIVDKDNSEVILRAMGLGGWMLQEGYMLQTADFASTQHGIRAKIKDLVGETNTQNFYDAWLAHHFTRTDVDSLKSWGFNSVRLPMHYNLYTLPIEQEPVPGQQTWLDKGFAMTDSLLKWCAANQMYLILDLHAAPGGQGHDAAISDYDATKPSLWESDANKQKAIALWRKLAERYANEPWIGGYDLINEPNWNFTAGANQNGCGETNNAPLRQLYVDITTAIRQVDQNHMIFIEGNCWANNYTGMFPKWDNNMVASFHKYWNYNDQSSLDFIVNIRNGQNLPVWLGESGENSNVWFTNAISLMERNGIGWAWWPLKKVESVVNPLTVKKPEAYNTLLNYWKNGGTKPTQDFAVNALAQLTENLKIQNNVFHKDVIDAMFRQVQTSGDAMPYRSTHLPGVIALTDYDLGKIGKAYYDSDSATYHVNTSTYTAWNSGWSYRNDAVDIEASTDADPSANGYNVGWTQTGEWLQYTVTVDSTAGYTVTLRYAASGGNSRVNLVANNTIISPSISLASTGGGQTWANKLIDNVVLYKGVNRIRINILAGGANLGFLKFALSKKLSETPFSTVAAETANEAQEIYLYTNKKIDGSTVIKDGFGVTVNGATSTVTSISFDDADPARIKITINTTMFDSDNIKLSYQGTDIKATDGSSLQNFSELSVSNNLPVHHNIPGKIEAESFYANQGLQPETTSDTGGGLNMGYTSAGDYLDYLIQVAEDGTYPLEVRVACNSQAGKILFEQRTMEGALLHQVTLDVPVTGGWQNWQTVTTKLELSAGHTRLRLKILQPEFNINWLQFKPAEVISGIRKDSKGALYLYPNPAGEFINIAMPETLHGTRNYFSILSADGTHLKNTLAGTAPVANIYVGDLPAGMYFVELSHHNEYWRGKFIVRR